MTYLEPASYLQIIFMHIGGRFLKFKVTPVQEKMLENRITQAVIFYSLLVFSTKSLVKGLIILVIVIMFIQLYNYRIICLYNHIII